jgi:uncharacterized YigZ family protein
MIQYKTVAKQAEAEQIIEKSRFIAYVKPVESKEEADEFIASIKSEHKSATHNVPAFVIGDQFQLQWASDDGEPQGTSGAPMVQMLVKEGITNVVIVVTRYFGGIKLGIPGLIRAYKTSTADALANAQIVEKIASKLYRIHFGYMSMNSVMKVLKDMGLEQKNQKFDMECSIDTNVRLSLVDTFEERMADVEGCHLEEI